MLCNCCKTMKQKLPERRSSYKNFNLDQIRTKTQFFSKLWTKCSLIGLLIAILKKKKHLKNSFYFQIIPFSHNSRKNKNLIQNTLILFAFFIYISIYYLGKREIVKRKKFNFTKIQRRIHDREDYKDIYLKSFRNFYNHIYFNNSNYACMGGKVEKNEFIDFVNPNKNNLKRMKKILYMDNKPLFKSISIHQSFFSSQKEPEFFRKYLAVENEINKFISQRKIKNNLKNPICYDFFELYSIREFVKNIIINKNFDKILKNTKNIHYSENFIESDDIGIIIFIKIQKNYSNFLWNYSLPLNPAYDIIPQNFFFNKRILDSFWKKWKRLFLEILYSLVQRFDELKNSNVFINCMKLKQDSTTKNDQLNFLIDKYNKIKDPNLLLLQLLSNQNEISSTNGNHKKKSINNYLLIQKILNKYNLNFIKNPIQQIQFFNFYLKKKLPSISNSNYKKRTIIHKYFLTWETIIIKNSVCDIEDMAYNKLIFQVYEWFFNISNSKFMDLSKKIISNSFFMKIKFIKILEIFFRNNNSKNINEIYNSLLISNHTFNLYHKNDKLFDKSKRSINKDLLIQFNFNDKSINNWIVDLFINEINEEFFLNSFNNLTPSKNDFFNYVINTKLVSTSNNEINFINNLQKIRLNCNKRFFFYLKKLHIQSFDMIYSQFLKNLLKYNGFATIIKQKFLIIFEKKIIMLAQSQISNILLPEISYKNSEFHFFYNLNYPSFPKYFFIRNYSENFVKGMLITQPNNTKLEKSYYNVAYLKSLVRSKNRNSETFRSINKIFIYLKYSKHQNSEYEIRDKEIQNTNKISKYNQFQKFDFFVRFISFEKYTSWFFTFEWWNFYIHIFLEKFREVFLTIIYHFEYLVDDNIRVTRKKFLSLWDNEKIFHDLILKWNSRIFLDYEEKIIFNFVWSKFQLINNWNSLHWTVFTLISFFLLSYKNSFSIWIGSDCIDLWKYFETIKYLTDTSRVYYFTKLMHHNKIELNKTENSVIYFFKNLKHYAINIRFFLLTKKKLEKLLIINKTLDLSRRKRNLLVQSLITQTRLKEYGFQLYPKQKLLNDEFGYRATNQPGLSYLRYLSRILKKNLVNYPLHFTDKWIYFTFLQKIIFSQTLRQEKELNPGFQRKPIPLQFGLSRSKGILLIGPVETGRSYLIKNLAADSYVPLLGISINKFLYNKPDVLTESWMNILIESLRRLNLILDLAKGMSPCIIWIQNIHQLDVNRPTQNIESDPTFLLGILLKHFQTGFIKTRTDKNIIMIGSTHIPKKVDPALISPDRLDRIINIRLFNNYQKKNQFFILLNKNNLQLKKNLLYFNEFDSRTIGYNIRDLAALTNEVLLISITRNQSVVYTDTMKLAFHRQIFGFTYTGNKPNFQHNFQNLLYKIGRAVIQNILIKDSAKNPLNITNFLWKKKFYYLSQWYLEPSVDESIVKEFTILTHVLGCLAGTAARDSWFLLKNRENSIPLDKSVENDLNLASNILESFSMEFPWLEICETPFVNYERREIKTLPTRHFLSIMQNGVFAIANKSILHSWNNSQYESLISRRKLLNEKNCEFQNTAWSPRFWRLSFFRSHLFDWIKRPNDFEFSYKFPFSKKEYMIPNNLKEKNHFNPLIGVEKEQLIYERILPRVRKRNVQELESQFEQILLEEQSEILGFFRSSTQYRMEYQLENKPRLFIGKRILWDPIGSFLQIRHFIFSRRDFFVDEEMLRRLYVTYGVRRERERSLYNNRIKRFFLYRGYNKDLINKLSVRWWNQLPMDEKQNIDMLKRIEKIGIRLKRPQIFTPVYLYQGWLIENLPEKFTRFEFLAHRQRWLGVTNSLVPDSFAYTTLLESYQYLLEFFLNKKRLLNQIAKMLLVRKWLFQNEIGSLIHSHEKEKI
uniref:hypothetical protein RF2 n=1 Tax=Pleurozia gigantea TaxID=255983 RepID=UPI00286C3719|nr:hypothetical protein RF2 [Pleurozia gigantea]WKR35055.1 hypothetical protein RF2 [Pleurozia gigantea]